MPSVKARVEQIHKRPRSGGSKAQSTTTDTNDEVRKHPWRALFFFTTKANTPMLVLGIFFSMMAGAMSPASAYVEGKLFDGFTSYATGKIDVNEFFQREKKYIYYLLGISGGSWLFNFLEMTIWIASGELQAKSARDRLFHGLLKRDIAWYDLRKTGIGALLPRIQAQIRELQLATSQPLGATFSLVSTSVLSLVQALYISWDLTLVSIATTPIIMLAVFLVGRNMQRNYDLQQKKLTEAQKYTSSAFTAIETVKCFNGQEIEHEKYMTKVAEAALIYYRVASANALQLAMVVLLSISMFVQGFYYGGVLIREHKKSVADVLTTFLSAIGAFQALNGIVPTLLFLEKGKIAGSTLRSIMAEMQRSSDVRDGQRLVAVANCFGDIDVKNITFAYPSLPQQLALDDVTLYIPGGELTFIIGKSGSGKSTLGQLLLGFYRSRSGSISLDGADIDRLDLTWLRTNITLVEQTTMLFNDTIFNNIAFGKRDHSQVNKQEVQEAVEFALLQLMITDMPNGLETVVGYKGSSMSGGQRQRLALARARLRDTPVLLLDESTSALDHISRGLMMDAIRQWRHGKTTIIITHDISQIQPDDYAYILEHGKVVQDGYRKHMEKIRDSPFQGFLPPEQRATASPYDSRKTTVFESIRTRGSSLDSLNYRYSRMQSDPLEAHLDASENKRTSAIFNMIKDSRPIPRVGAGAFTTPWMRLATSPPSLDDVRPTPHRASGWWDLKPLKATPEELRNGKRMSRRLEGLLERTGKSAADSRLAPTGQRRQRKEVHRFVMDKDQDHPCTKSTYGDAPDEEAQIVNHKSYKQILATLWPSINRHAKAALVVGCYSTTIHALGSPIFAFVLSKLLRTYAIPGGDRHKALIYSMAMLGLAVVDAAHTYLGHICLEFVGQKWVDSIRSKAMSNILDQPRAFFDKEENAVSRLTGNLDRNAEELRNLVGRFSGLIWTAVMMSSVAVVWAIVAQWKMTLLALIAAPYIFGATKIYAAVSEKWESYSNSAAEDAASIFTEAFSNIKTLRALTLEQHFIDKYTKATNFALVIGFKRSFFSGFFYGISDSAGNFAITLVFYVGARLVKSGTPVQHVVQVFTMLIFTITNLGFILVAIPQIGSTKDTGSRLLRLAELPHDSHEHLGDTRITTVGDIIFEDLRFAYPSRPDQAVLQNINLHIQPGASTAIVGGSGSGKSTIANLLLNLYGIRPLLEDGYHRNGDLIVGGRSIDHIDTSSLRTLVTPVSQSPTLFSASVAENIAYGLPSSSPYNSLSAIQAAAAQAGIHDFIISLPHGYDTQIGDGGLGLSGGQSQRLNIARALVRKPAVLILDEATSALDVESANLIRETVAHLVRDPSMNMTVIIITHDRDMMAMADRVVVLDQGRIIEEGGFDELLAKNGALTNLLSGGEWSDSRRTVEVRPRGAPFMKGVDWRKRGRNNSGRR